MRDAKPRTGVVLAAGIGSRFDRSNLIPYIKPLALLNGKPLIIRTIENLEKAGCTEIVVVLGWKANTVRRWIQDHYGGPLHIKFAFNRRHDLKNGVSVLAAKNYVEKDFILTMVDHYFEDQIMTLVSVHQPPIGGATLCVDYKLSKIFDMDDATKVLEKAGCIKAIGKKLSQFNCIDTGIFLCTEGLFGALEGVYSKKGDASLSDGVQVLADAQKMNVLSIENAFWQDIDTPEMLAHAEKLLKRHIRHRAQIS